MTVASRLVLMVTVFFVFLTLFGAVTSPWAFLALPAAVLSRPEHAVGAYRAFERCRTFYYDLRDQGMLPDLPAPAPHKAKALAPKP